MRIEIFPIAEADVVTLMKSINRVIINPVIFFLFAVAMVYFLWGLAQYFLSPDSKEVRDKSKAQMIWGIIGLFIMVSVFGILQVVVNTFGITNVKIQSNGDYTVTVPNAPSVPNYNLTSPSGAPTYNLNNNLGTWDASKNLPVITGGVGTKNSYYVVTTAGTTNIDGTSLWEVGDIIFYDGLRWSKKSNATQVQATDGLVQQTKLLVYSPLVNGDPTKSPLTFDYQPSPLCWRKAIVAQSLTEYQASNSVQSLARAAYLSGTGQTEVQAQKTEHALSLALPVVAERQTLYDPVTKNYFVWWGVVAPVGAGTLKDCRTLPFPANQSNKANPITGDSSHLGDTATYYAVTDSGVASTLDGARNIAIQNALIQIAIKENLNTTIGIPYNILAGKYYPVDPVTGNFDYWVTIESPK